MLDRFADYKSVEEALAAVLKTMDPAEKDRLGLLEGGRSAFVQKVRELEAIRKGYCGFEGLGDIVEKFFVEGESAGEEDGEEEDDDSENSYSAADRYNRDVALDIH